MRTRFLFLILLVWTGYAAHDKWTPTASAAARRKSDTYADHLARIRRIPINRLAEALPEVEEAINTAPERYEAYYYAAYALYRADRLEESKARAEEAQARIHEGGSPLAQWLLKRIAYKQAHPGKELPRTRAVFRETPGGYTSVIIDARGLGVERSMAPKIRRTDGIEVWGTKEVDPDYVIEEGIVAYARTGQAAKQNKRCGALPLIFRAVKPQAKIGAFDACLTALDARALLNADKKYHFLDANRVLFLIDN